MKEECLKLFSSVKKFYYEAEFLPFNFYYIPLSPFNPLSIVFDYVYFHPILYSYFHSLISNVPFAIFKSLVISTPITIYKI